MKYDKLVRDKIPELIASRGGTAKTHVAAEEEFEAKLSAKLTEEVQEFLAAAPEKRGEELADILEVIDALQSYYGIEEDEVRKIKIKKADERGGFSKRIILEES